MPYASINGQEIFFEDSAGAGFPILMMHGFLMDQSLFDPQVAVLAPKYRCIRFDARAFGQSKWDQKPFSLYDTVSDAIGLMDALGITKAAIVGMSQGGYAALRMALTHKERVAALVLMSTQYTLDADNFKAQCLQMRDLWEAQGPIEPLLEGLATSLLGPNDAPGMAKHWAAWLPKWRTYSGHAVFCAVNCLNDRDCIAHRMDEILVPALVTHGESDLGIPPALGKSLSQKLVNCFDFINVPGAAHAANHTHPAGINQAMMRFLGKALS